jgi:hypothetical protein
MTSSWVQTGAPCICVEEEWHDFFSDDEVQGPMIGERYVIAEYSVIDGAAFVKVLGDQFFYEASAFMPVDDLDRDAALFQHALTGSAVPFRESECA